MLGTDGLDEDGGTLRDFVGAEVVSRTRIDPALNDGYSMELVLREGPRLVRYRAWWPEGDATPTAPPGWRLTVDPKLDQPGVWYFYIVAGVVLVGASVLIHAVARELVAIWVG